MKLVERLQKRFKSSHVKPVDSVEITGSDSAVALVTNAPADSMNADEQKALKRLLERYSDESSHIETDFGALLAITAEVKAINNQAALLHGERIKKAQDVLKKYKEGAFSAWLIETYGNRQTPYNFLQYHEFLKAMPAQLQSQIDAMPRQAIYTLASRNAALSDKRAFVERVSKAQDAQTKEQLLTEIRRAFPLKETDGRRTNASEAWIRLLERAHAQLENGSLCFTQKQSLRISSLLKGIHDSLS
jgi:hypothetical protein